MMQLNHEKVTKVLEDSSHTRMLGTAKTLPKDAHPLIGLACRARVCPLVLEMVAIGRWWAWRW